MHGDNNVTLLFYGFTFGYCCANIAAVCCGYCEKKNNNKFNQMKENNKSLTLLKL